MTKTITHLPQRAQLHRKKRVAAYARVSSGKDAMLHSLSAQVDYYRSLIQSDSNWEFAGVYSDEAITGTKETRADFQRLLDDCRAGKIDMVITKTISRLARNTVTLLKTVRELKELSVDVFFEEQGIHTISADGELMLTILASYAQEESRSASENQKWRVRANFEQGIPWNGAMMGYRLRNGAYTIVPEEAAIIKAIFADYLTGLGYNAIAQNLNERNIPSPTGKRWCSSTIQKMLKNCTYAGNLVLQRTYSENHITKRMRPNKGELPKYLVEGAHEAIIDTETFEMVQAEIARRVEKHGPKKVATKSYPYTGLLECANCGKKYRRKVTATQVVWICATFNTLGKKYCASKQIPETMLDLHTAMVTSDISTISKIVVAENNTLYYHMRDGRIVMQKWEDRSRAASWTPEMREAARQNAKERRQAQCKEQ